MQLTIRMSDEYKARIEELALRTGLKKSDIAILAVKKYVEEYFDQDQDGHPYEKAQDLIGVASSGIPDLGTNHRRHLLNRIRKESR